jgi:hypothetical protein
MLNLAAAAIPSIAVHAEQKATAGDAALPPNRSVGFSAATAKSRSRGTGEVEVAPIQARYGLTTLAFKPRIVIEQVTCSYSISSSVVTIFKLSSPALARRSVGSTLPIRWDRSDFKPRPIKAAVSKCDSSS